ASPTGRGAAPTGFGPEQRTGGRAPAPPARTAGLPRAGGAAFRRQPGARLRRPRLARRAAGLDHPTAQGRAATLSQTAVTAGFRSLPADCRSGPVGAVLVAVRPPIGQHNERGGSLAAAARFAFGARRDTVVYAHHLGRFRGPPSCSARRPDP